MEHVHGRDIHESRAFIEALPDHGRTRALDCAAGIGRITKALLAPLYDKVDVLEPVAAMLDQARVELAEVPAVDHYYLCSMEQHTPTETYDLVVIQWAAIYLTDADFVKVFAQYAASLTPRGYLFFKENCGCARDDTNFLVDDDDSSLTRSDVHYKKLFEQAGLRVVREAYQKEWPAGLMPVKMYALRAKTAARAKGTAAAAAPTAPVATSV
ncbi:methyltransferase [Strigomonas culicis]|uniref:Alpha N-terminal protein methyltransferase 1 n=1 Tax=Strigomonas culicis TaxID=28005 RepID=S9UET1_9TRYP|nr:methyltransferase [Strigomonas culicis]|eukprot:EPY29332.1 methyltransferase [Strigomonas culicis]